MARGNSPASGTSPKKDKIILLLRQGETDSIIIANKVGCAVGYVHVLKNELFRELLQSQKP